MVGTPANSINVSGSGIVGFNGTVFNSSTVTYHSLLIGGSTSASIVNLGVALNGQIPIGSTGANPILKTLNQGPNITITNGAGSISIAGVGFSSVVRQTFTVTGSAQTYTPTSRMIYCDVEVVGGGGGGGGVAATSATVAAIAVGGGGGAGGYARKIFSAAQIGSSTTLNIGAGGSASGGAGTAGGATSFGWGTSFSATGGSGGASSALNYWGTDALGGLGGIGGGGNFNTRGTPGRPGFNFNPSLTGDVGYGISGAGGSTFFGGGGLSKDSTSYGAGLAATSYGGGGSGALTNISQAGATGGNGFAGICIITEYCG